jgi:hypothetical protein
VTLRSAPSSSSGNRASRRSRTGPAIALGGAGVFVAGSAAALLTAFAGSAGASATITVDSSGDGAANAANCTDITAGNCTLRDAVAAAVNGDVIVFDAAISAIALTNGEIATPAVSIIGPGASALTITTTGASGAYTMFRVSGTGDALISGVTLTKNRVKSLNVGNFTLDGVTVSGSTSTYGGALYAGNTGDLEVKNSTFGNNEASSNGGAVYVYNGGDATISDSVFKDNDAERAGGAIYSYGVDLTLTRTLVTGNTAQESGGGVYFGPSVGNASITDSTIDSNTAGEYGGGASFSDGITVLISNSTVSNNSATGGAGLDFDGAGSNATINNSTITANASIGGGGGIYIQASSTLTINQSTISANTSAGTTARYSGGGISIGSGSPMVTLSGSIVSGNASAFAGAADFGLYSNDPSDTGSFTATNSIIGEVDPRLTANGTNNIMSTNPMLGALADNGGPTKTMALLTGSPAINAGPNPVATFIGNEFDQRGAGYARVVGGVVDIGAFEVQPGPAPSPDTPVVPAFTG